jgi:hypothetical protein
MSQRSRDHAEAASGRGFHRLCLCGDLDTSVGSRPPLAERRRATADHAAAADRKSWRGVSKNGPIALAERPLLPTPRAALLAPRLPDSCLAPPADPHDASCGRTRNSPSGTPRRIGTHHPPINHDASDPCANEDSPRSSRWEMP